MVRSNFWRLLSFKYYDYIDYAIIRNFQSKWMPESLTYFIDKRPSHKCLTHKCLCHKHPGHKWFGHKRPTLQQPTQKCSTHKRLGHKCSTHKRPGHKCSIHKRPIHKCFTHKCPGHKCSTHQRPCHKCLTLKHAGHKRPVNYTFGTMFKGLRWVSCKRCFTSWSRSCISCCSPSCSSSPPSFPVSRKPFTKTLEHFFCPLRVYHTYKA